MMAQNITMKILIRPKIILLFYQRKKILEEWRVFKIFIREKILFGHKNSSNPKELKNYH
jgi:hypothetical protein